MNFQRNEDRTISVVGGKFSDEAEFSVHLLGQAGPLLETTITMQTLEGVAVYLVDGYRQPVGASSWVLHARLLRVEGGAGDEQQQD